MTISYNRRKKARLLADPERRKARNKRKAERRKSKE
jgi:hypothetical protein